MESLSIDKFSQQDSAQEKDINEIEWLKVRLYHRCSTLNVTVKIHIQHVLESEINLKQTHIS